MAVLDVRESHCDSWIAISVFSIQTAGYRASVSTKGKTKTIVLTLPSEQNRQNTV